ncbi:MAG: TrmH family RNA methyltransferase [Clostridiales bacterium]|jgi:TrmH family RNA methyltransferase|nr:TrmH family RNA methyltransferase [Clostridiales bacterium]
MDPGTRLRPYKKGSEYSYTFGVFPTIELCEKRPESLVKIISCSSALSTDGFSLLCKKAEELSLKVITDDKTFYRLAPNESCHAIGVFMKYSCVLDANLPHIVLENPSDMGNLGTIIRTISAFGIKNLSIIAPGADIFDPKTIRASMGSLFYINFCYFNTFNEYRHCYTEHTFYPFMLSARTNLEELTLSKKKNFSLIFGNESKGLDDSYLEVGIPVKINHLSTVDSLNLASAVAIGTYIFTKGDRKNGL